VSIFVQTRQLCPGWVKIPKAERNMERLNQHRTECLEKCGYGDGDQWVYRFVPLEDFKALLAAPAADSVEGSAVEETATAPAKTASRGRKPKETAQAPAPPPPPPPPPAPVVEIDPLDAPVVDELDDLL